MTFQCPGCGQTDEEKRECCGQEMEEVKEEKSEEEPEKEFEDEEM